MKKLIAITLLLAGISTACGSRQSAATAPQTPKEVAQQFLERYTAGDPAAAEYVVFEGRFNLELALSPEAARTKQFPEELARQKENAPAKIECLSERITTDDDNGNPDLLVAYVEFRVNGETRYLTLFQVNDRWKVDITAMWYEEMFNGAC